MRITTIAAQISYVFFLHYSQPGFSNNDVKDVVKVACEAVDRQSCGDCDLDTELLRRSVKLLEKEQSFPSRAESYDRVLQIELCLLRGRHALSVVHLAPQQNRPSPDERDDLIKLVDREQLRLLKKYPNNLEALKAITTTGQLTDEAGFVAYSALSKLEPHNSDAIFWSAFFALKKNDPSWKSRFKTAFKNVTNAQSFRQYVYALLGAAEGGRCDEQSLKVLNQLRDNMEITWQGVEADADVMTPKMLKLSAKFTDDVLTLKCVSAKPPK
jgi:hypothetical protein